MSNEYDDQHVEIDEENESGNLTDDEAEDAHREVDDEENEDTSNSEAWSDLEDLTNDSGDDFENGG